MSGREIPRPRILADSPEEALRLATALAGGGLRKIAQPWARYDMNRDARPNIGDLWQVRLWDGTPIVTAQTTGAALIPTDKVTDEAANGAGYPDRDALIAALARDDQIHFEGLKVRGWHHAAGPVQAQVLTTYLWTSDKPVLVLRVTQGFVSSGSVLIWRGMPLRVVSIEAGYALFCRVDVSDPAIVPQAGDVLTDRVH